MLTRDHTNTLIDRPSHMLRLWVAAEVRMPSGKVARPHITDNKDGTIAVKFMPTEKGLHEMDIKYEGNHIPGMENLFL